MADFAAHTVGPDPCNYASGRRIVAARPADAFPCLLLPIAQTTYHKRLAVHFQLSHTKTQVHKR